VRFAIAIPLLLLCACAKESIAGLDGARRLDRGLVALTEAPDPPPLDSPTWEPVSLPDRWRGHRLAAGGFAWYRLEVPGPIAPGAEWAVYLPHLCMNAAVRVNGAPVGAGGRFSEPVARNFNRPLYFSFPSDLLDRSTNAIEIRLFVYSHQFGELGAPWVGPDAALRQPYETTTWQRTSLAQLATSLCLVTVLLSGALWLGNRLDPMFGWLLLASALWSAESFNYWLRDIPVSADVWERAMPIAMDWFMLALACWAHRYAGVERPWVERALAAAALLTLAVNGFAPPARAFAAANVMHAAILPVAIYGTLLILRHTLRSRPAEAAVYVPAGAAALGFGLHDLALQFGALDPGAPYLLPYVAPLLLVSFGSTVVLRFASALRNAETLNRELEQRVLEKHRELDRSFAERRTLEGQKVVAEERERLVREMHDGLAGQLVSLLSVVEADPHADPRVAEGVRAALDDMRLVIDSLDPALQTLGGALGAARARFEPALAKSGVTLEWQAGDLPPTPWLGPQDYLQVLRIVQEALVNTVRHARASRVVVRSARAVDEQGAASIVIEVCDDGRGIDAGAAARPGARGLRHMRERAARLSGELRIESANADTEGGTRVALWLRLPAAPG
jgi:signal transduction histidine kinase